MVQERTCDYTGETIEPGTGKMYVKTDGTVFWFKDSKAEKNYFMGRESRDLEWIGYEEDEEDEASTDEAADEEDEDAAQEEEAADEDDTEAEEGDEASADEEEDEAADESDDAGEETEPEA